MHSEWFDGCLPNNASGDDAFNRECHRRIEGVIPPTTQTNAPPEGGALVLFVCPRGKPKPTNPMARDTDSTVTRGGNAMSALDAAAIAACLSTPRLGTYTAASQPSAGEDGTVVALRLYQWNVEISAALMVPIHIFEVAIRNAVADAIAATHGPQWPWNAAFVRSLPGRSGGHYSPRQDVVNTAGQQPTTGKVIPELKLAFWESMFTARHDGQIWDLQLMSVLPNLPATVPIGQSRNAVRAELGQIRVLRNRIAHHEPIFRRTIADDLERMRTLVGYRSAEMRGWLDTVESVTTVLATRP